METLLKINNLNLEFEINDKFYRAIKDLSFELKKGTIHAVIGESGSGKTMSVMSIIKLLPKNAKITSGEILFEGKNLLELKEKEMNKIRGRKIALIPQDPMTSLVPLYNIEGTAGLVPLFVDRDSQTPIDYIHIPNLPRCDGAIYVVGDSMYPLLKSGDIVLYKQVSGIENIFWGDMYLLSIDIDGEEYVTVKYIQKSEREGCVKLVSQNPHHADKDVPIEKIRALAFVKASIRMNSIR